MNNPSIKPHLTPVLIPDEGVLLLSEGGTRALDARVNQKIRVCLPLMLSEGGTRALHGRLYERLVPLLDGRLSTDDLVAALADEFDAARVYYALLLLEKNGHLTEAIPPHIAPEQAAFWSGLGLDPAAALSALAAQPVALHSVGMVDLEPLQTALSRLGIRRRDEEPSLAIVLTDDYRRAELAELNARFQAARQPWLVLRPNGHEPWIGPLYRPEDAGCHACLTKRLADHRQAEAFAARHHRQDAPLITARALLPTTQQLVAELAVLGIAQHLAGAASSLAGAVISLDSRTLATREHRLLPDAFCPVCGAPPRPEVKPVRLTSRKVHFVQDGGHRHVAPDETLRRYERLVSPITGIVTQLQPIQEDAGIAQVYVAGHNNVYNLDQLEHLKKGLRFASAGKGVSATQAKTSALCEALERYSGLRQGDEVVVTASYRQMLDAHGDDVIHPNAVMRFSERQLAEHETRNTKPSRFNRICEPLDEDLAIDWTPAWSLSRERHRYLPTQLLYYRSPASPDCDRFLAYGCSNGNASGNTLEEAVLQGFFELVERDATALWWYNRLRRPGVDLASFGEPWLLDLVDHYGHQGRDSWALDLTSDLGIPAFVAVSRKRAGDQDRLLFGLGCHLDARIALQRAFAEMNQMLAMAREQPEAGIATVEDEETQDWLTTATLENQPYMAPDPSQPARRYQDFPNAHSGELLTDIAHCQAIIERHGLEMLVLDQTRTDAGLPVVKVIVPGLRHFWARFGPGRLYDVPVAMGWLERPLSEDTLNPIPIFI